MFSDLHVEILGRKGGRGAGEQDCSSVLDSPVGNMIDDSFCSRSYPR